MERIEFTQLFAEFRNEAVVVTGPGGSSGALWLSSPHPATIFYMEMGYSTPVCLGLALAVPHRKVVALEGEGTAILGMPVLATIGRYRPSNLVVIVFDNGVYGTGGGRVETATKHGTDLCAVARGCGFDDDKVIRIDSLEEAREVLPVALSEPGPWFLLAKVEPTDVVSGQRATPEIDHVEMAYSLRNNLRGIETRSSRTEDGFD